MEAEIGGVAMLDFTPVRQKLMTMMQLTAGLTPA